MVVERAEEDGDEDEDEDEYEDRDEDEDEEDEEEEEEGEDEEEQWRGSVFDKYSFRPPALLWFTQPLVLGFRFGAFIW